MHLSGDWIGKFGWWRKCSETVALACSHIITPTGPNADTHGASDRANHDAIARAKAVCRAKPDTTSGAAARPAVGSSGWGEFLQGRV